MLHWVGNPGGNPTNIVAKHHWKTDSNLIKKVN